MNTNLTFAQNTPIALFVFKRPSHTTQTLNSLAQNDMFIESPLYIFCDGPRNQADVDSVSMTRDIVNKYPHPNKIIIHQDVNLGLAASIIDGVTDLCKKYGRVIVVEDDLIVSPAFLGYMHNALRYYSDHERVMQVSAHQFNIDATAQTNKCILLPFISSWGWATWAHAWDHFDANATGWQTLLKNSKMRQQFDIHGCYSYSDMLFSQMTGKIDSWAIRWNWSVFKKKGLVIYPPVSLVDNIGFDGSGTHCKVQKNNDVSLANSEFSYVFPAITEVDSLHNVSQFQRVQKAILRFQGGLAKRVIKRVRCYIYCIYYRICFN